MGPSLCLACTILQEEKRDQALTRAKQLRLQAEDFRLWRDQCAERVAWKRQTLLDRVDSMLRGAARVRQERQEWREECQRQLVEARYAVCLRWEVSHPLLHSCVLPSPMNLKLHTREASNS